MGGLSLEGQLNSYPNLLAGQFKAVGGGDFVQPLFNANQANGSGFLKLTGFDATGNPLISFESTNTANIAGSLAASRTLLTKYTGPTNQNLGVPGIRVADITTNGYGLNNPMGFNPYFERLLAPGAAGAVSYLQYVTAQVAAIKPTFFTNWLGNNDVLGYATSGGVDPLTPAAEFTTKYNQSIDVLTAGGAKGLVATIPAVTAVPFFTTVPTAAVAAQINATPIPPALQPAIKQALGLPQTAPLPAGLRFGFYITTGANVKRLATPNDLLTLTSRAVINSPSSNPTQQPLPVGIGLEIPGAPAATAAALAAGSNALPNNFVLDADEVTAVTTRTGELNAAIVASAQRKNLAVFDANAYFNTVARNGVVINTTPNSAAFISGNLFSLDGVHPTPRGYALVANEMIKAINAKYGSSVPGVDASTYRGVKFP
jgi:lysophospholipase L1-like esterase